MAGNSNLKDSFKNKQDEFYTDISLVENELKHYKNHFRDKIIFFNCDDPYESELSFYLDELKYLLKFGGKNEQKIS